MAVAMNGDPLPPEHGFPARLIVPGLYGYVSATKWLTKIELTTLEAFDGYWVPLGWAKEAPILTQSRIDVPRLRRLARAPARCRSPASPGRRTAASSKVEVQVDDGAWAAAELSTPISDATWVQWLYRWDATAGDHTLRVRATDGTGEVQTATVTEPAPDGARGYHTIRRQGGLTPRAESGPCLPPSAPLIINPAAAHGPRHASWRRASRRARRTARQGRLVETREAGHAERLAAAATDQGHDRVVAVGGDGTVQEVLNGLMAAGVGPDGGRRPSASSRAAPATTWRAAWACRLT